MKNLKQRGRVITWTNGTGSDVVSDQVVTVGRLMGVATGDIANGETGEVFIDEQIVTAPKVSAAVVTQGEAVIWDASEGAFQNSAHTPATGDVSECCVAAAAAGAGATTVDVILNKQIGTVA